MNFYLPFVIANIVIGYLFGSLSWSIIIGKFFYHQDPREFASKNAGATNSLRIYGKKTAILILILDILKTIIPTIIIWVVTKYVYFDAYQQYISSSFNPLSLTYLCAFFTIVGHSYPIFFKLKGGKGAATYGAFIFLISPWIALIALTLLILLIKRTKMVSLAVLIIAFFVPFTIFIPAINYLYIIDNDINNLFMIDIFPYLSMVLLFALMLLSSGLIFFKHRENIKRIINHEERKIGSC